MSTKITPAQANLAVAATEAYFAFERALLDLAEVDGPLTDALLPVRLESQIREGASLALALGISNDDYLDALRASAARLVEANNDQEVDSK